MVNVPRNIQGYDFLGVLVQNVKKKGNATCSSCHNALSTNTLLAACPKCGSFSKILNSINVAGVEIFPCVDLKVKNPRYQGRRKYIREVKSIAENSVDGRLVRKDRLIDRGNNRYREKVTAVDTGSENDTWCSSNFT